MQAHHTKRAKSREKAEDFFAIGDPCKTMLGHCEAWMEERSKDVSFSAAAVSCVLCLALVWTVSPTHLFQVRKEPGYCFGHEMNH